MATIYNNLSLTSSNTSELCNTFIREDLAASSLTHYETSEFLCSRRGRQIFHNHQRGEMKSGSFEPIPSLIVKFIPAYWDPDEISVKNG